TSARSKCQGKRDAAILIIGPGQSNDAASEPGDRAAEPFQIIEAMADEIAQDAPAIVTARLPAFQAQPGCLVLDVPGDDHVPQPPDVAARKKSTRPLPGRKLRKIEVDRARRASSSGALKHRFGTGEIYSQGLFDEDRLAAIKRAHGDLRLQVG